MNENHQDHVSFIGPNISSIPDVQDNKPSPEEYFALTDLMVLLLQHKAKISLAHIRRDDLLITIVAYSRVHQVQLNSGIFLENPKAVRLLFEDMFKMLKEKYPGTFPEDRIK